MKGTAEVTFCVLLYGDHAPLARRVLESIRDHCPRQRYRLVVGANAIGSETQSYVDRLCSCGAIDRLHMSPSNLNKCPMMRRMFSKISTDFIWWFDDDSYLEQPNTFDTWVKQARTASPNTVMWGQIAQCDKPEFFSEGIDVLDFVRTASWYRGMPPPSWRPGGKGEFDYRGLGVGDGSWLFILGGCWLIRTAAVRALDWPDPRLAKMGDDVFLGEAIRQQGWTLENQREAGLVINAGKPRGNPGPARP